MTMALWEMVSAAVMILGLSSVAETRARVVRPQYASPPAMLVFGDSLVDAGTNFYLSGVPNAANSRPYGETFFRKPTGRFSDGKTISDFLADCLKIPLLEPFLKPRSRFSHGINFASSGSGILNTTNNEQNDLLPLSAQVGQLQQIIARNRSLAFRVSDAIAVLVTGSNDLIGGYIFNASAQQAYTPQRYLDLLVAEYTKSLLFLHGSGVRKIVLVGLPPLGCSPPMRVLQEITNNATGCFETLNQLALAFNAGLDSLFQQLTKDLCDTKLILVKPYDFVLGMINNGTKYGFEETERNCCGGGAYNAVDPCGPDSPFLCRSPSKFMFWDFHPTHQAAKVISQQICNGLPAFVEPMNLRTLAQI